MTGPEIVQFSAAVNSAFNVHDLTTLLLRLNRRLSDYVSANVPFAKQVEQLIALANSEAWISQLVMEVVSDRPANQAVKSFLANNPDWDPAINPPVVHPCDALQVFGGKSFIGRREFRKFLKAMSNATGKKVLLVTSEQRKVGKTYSKELVDFLAVHRPPSGVAYADLDNDDYDPGRLAASIARPMGMEAALAPQQGTQQAARWSQELISWLVPTTPNPLTAVWWIVLDGFRQKIPSEATQDFIAQLAQRIQGTLNFRLVLLNYTYRLPLAVDAFVFKDKVAPIEKAEVEDFLSQVHERRHGTKPSVEALSEYVTSVYDRVAQYAQEYPESAQDQLLLNKAVTEATDIIVN